MKGIRAFSYVKRSDTTWQTASGDIIDIKDMDKTHIIAVVRMLSNYSAKIPKIMEKKYNEIKIKYPEYFL